MVVHVGTALDDGRWVIELRTAPDAALPARGGQAGERLRLPGGAMLRLLEPAHRSRRPGATSRQPGPVGPVRHPRLWRAAMLDGEMSQVLAVTGRAIGYGYLAGQYPLQTTRPCSPPTRAAPRCPARAGRSPPTW